MCYNFSLTKEAEYIEKRFNVKFKELDVYKPFYNVSGFTSPRLPVICSDDQSGIQFFNWGLIPFWIKDEKDAETIKVSTLNARAESIIEKPSFRNSIKQKRCLVPADGFFEWHENNGRKYPFYIKFRDHRLFSFAGLWDEWENKNKNIIYKSFSIITTIASPFIEKIHNVKKRMPVILKNDDESRWLDVSCGINEILKLLVPHSDDEIEAFSVSRLIIEKNIDNNIPEAIKLCKYAELQEF